MPLINLNIFVHSQTPSWSWQKRKKESTFTTKKNVESSHTLEQIENFMEHCIAVTHIIYTKTLETESAVCTIL